MLSSVLFIALWGVFIGVEVSLRECGDLDSGIAVDRVDIALLDKDLINILASDGRVVLG